MGLTIGLLHPGEMGSSVGAAARARADAVLWCSDRRSDETQERARADGLEAVTALGEMVERCDVIISVCPPVAARTVAETAAVLRFGGTYVDANAVSPATARLIGEIVTAGGATFVDGGIVGPPARTAGRTILYLSGEDCAPVEEVFSGSLLETYVAGRAPGEASAVKMAFAGWTKGSAALLLGIRALAEAEGVTEGLLHAWSRFGPDLAARVEATAMTTAPKAWRFSDEMHEIAATFEAAGLPSGFHEGAAQVYERMAPFKVGGADLARVLQVLLRR